MSERDSDTLKNIQNTMEDIKAVLTLVFQDKLTEAKKSLLAEGSVKEQVYELCDGTKSTQDIARALKKSEEYVNSYLSRLRREGLIHTREKDGKHIHEQVF